MTIEVRVPQLPESVADATLVAWHKKPGDAVSRDENLVDLETDKVVLEVPAPAAGVIRELKVQNGATVTSGQLLALLEEGAAATASAPAAPRSEPAAETKGGASAEKLAPSVRRLVEEHKLDAGAIPGSGRDGRVTKGDVLAHLTAKPVGDAAAGIDKAAAAAVAVPAAGRGERRVPMTRLRSRIAERLVQAQSTAAMLTTFNEVDLKAVNELRARYKDRFEKEHGARLGFMSFFVKAAIEALKEVPQVNAEIRGETIVYRNYYDVGIAVGGGRGLVVPIIRNAEKLSFAEIEVKIGEYAVRARDNKLTLDELTGGTFTISNGGIYGSMLSTPILNYPQSGILGLHAIQDRPVARDGQVVIRPMMYVALTYDHRVIDGRESVTFLKRIKECVENPQRILLEV